MATKKEVKIEDFLVDISPEYAEAVQATHDLLAGQGCVVKMQAAKSGQVMSYNHPKTKKVLANLVSRKKGPMVRIYADHVADYMELLEDLPPAMETAIEKAPVCRRMLDPTKCNARCAMGYDFVLKGKRYQNCRYNAFLVPLTGETAPHIASLLEKEMVCRGA